MGVLDFALKYRFEEQDYFRRFPVGPEEYDHYRVRDSVTLTCAPQGKEPCRVEAFTPAELQAKFLIQSAYFLIFTLIFCILPVVLTEKAIRYQYRLLQDGVATIATIQKVTDRKKGYYSLCYQYEVDGNRHEGMMTDKAPPSDWPSVGDGVTIIYDPASAGKSRALVKLTAVSLKDGDFLSSVPAKSAASKKP